MNLRVIALAIAVLCATVRADPRIEAEASSHFEAGVALAKRGNHAAALAEFEKAYVLVPQWELLFNIGVTQRTLFRYGVAIKTFERYLVEGGERVPADRRKRVEAELAEIRKLVGELEITVDGGGRIEIDQVAEGDAPFAAPLLVAPGTHAIRATRGAAVDHRTITVVSGERVAIRLVPQLASGRLTVTTRPAHARIRIDGGPAVAAPWSGVLDAGGHRITAELAAHRTEVSEIRIDAGQDRALTVELVSTAVARTPWYRRPVVWIAVGVGVAAAAGGLGYLAQPEDADVVLRWP